MELNSAKDSSNAIIDSLRSVSPNETAVVLVRHGETTWNHSGVLQGQAEAELNDLGIRQAEAVAKCLSEWSSHIHFGALYSSDLVRASKTAEIIGNKILMTVSTVKGLRERHLGVLQGVPRQKARQDFPDAYSIFTSRIGSIAIPGGGESMNEFMVRVVKSLASLAAKHTGQIIIVVCHGGVLNALYHHACGRDSPHPAYNASLSIMRICGSMWTIGAWNSIQHIKSAGHITSTFGGGQDSA